MTRKRKQKPAAAAKTAEEANQQQLTKPAEPAKERRAVLSQNQNVLARHRAMPTAMFTQAGVRRIAREFGVNLAQVSGSGPKQRILKEDVQTFVKITIDASATVWHACALPAAPVVDFSKFGPIETQALSRIKKISGKNLQRNWMMIPHVTQFGEADITALEDFRQAQKAELEKQDVKLTPLVFIMKAVVASLKAFPHFNASLDASGENLVLKKYFHIGVAVDTPDGLVVPVIRDVDKKGLVDLPKN